MGIQEGLLVVKFVKPWEKPVWDFNELNKHLSMTCSAVCMLSRVQLFMTPTDSTLQVPLSKGFSRQEYWSGLPCSPPGDLPDPGIELASLTSPASAGGFFTTSVTCSTSQSCVGTRWKAVCLHVPCGWVVIWPVEMKDVTSMDRMDGWMLWERTK